MTPLAAGVVIFGWLAWGASSALAAAPGTTCTGPMTGHVQGPLNVPAGGACTLASGTFVLGATTVGGSLTADSVSFGGDITATGVGAISIRGSTLAGAVSVSGGTGTIDFSLDTFDGTAAFSSNTGGVSLAGDSFTNSLNCTNNTPAPHDGGANSFPGGVAPAGQCAGFGAAGTGPVPPTPNPFPTGPSQPTPTPTSPKSSPPPKPAPKPGAVKLVQVVSAPVLDRGTLVTRLRCVGTRRPCKETLHFLLRAGKHKLLARSHHIDLARGESTRLTLHLGRRRLRHAGVRITAGRQTLFDGPVRAA